MTPVRCVRLWIGRAGLLKVEVARLLTLLREEVLKGDLNLVLAPEESDEFDWIGEVVYSDRRVDFQGGGYLGLMTSGTTGPPKLVTRNFREVLSEKRGRGEVVDRWLLCYNPARWAGISVIAHVLRTGCQLVVPDGLDPESILAALPNCSHVSLTPSFFRKLLMVGSESMAAATITQVTFGGEYTPQSVIATARDLWPDARVTHVYASTELGDICAVSDGLEGIPISALGGRFELLDDGELVINGVKTSDHWERRADRLYFIGRKEDVVNVGGTKVHPWVVERACQAIAGVTGCRAFGIPNPLLGQVVALEYTGDVDVRIIRLGLAKRLSKVSVPARIERVHHISLTPAGKIARR